MIVLEGDKLSLRCFKEYNKQQQLNILSSAYTIFNKECAEYVRYLFTRYENLIVLKSYDDFFISPSPNLIVESSNGKLDKQIQDLGEDLYVVDHVIISSVYDYYELNIYFHKLTNCSSTFTAPVNYLLRTEAIDEILKTI